MHNFSEFALVEQPTIELFASLGYETCNANHETFGKRGMLGRETTAEVVLVRRLRAALRRLNPGMAETFIDQAIEELARDRSVFGPAYANREVYRLLKDGVPVVMNDRGGEEIRETVRVMDWNVASNNDFLLVSQLKVSGEMHHRRPDLVGFVNGLPLIFIELKTTHKRVEDSFHDNLRDYKDTIPQVFWYNALIILSNGHESRIGSITAGWEHFSEWKKISNEQEQGVISLETMIRGTCEQSRLLDLVENFILFSDAKGALRKLIAMNHQYLGVNNALEAVRTLGKNQGKLGVFWHTQGSGKSFSMVFFSQKVLRKIAGNWTFVIVTDRQYLDDQIYGTFQSVAAVTEEKVQAQSGEHLQQLLQENHRNIFTLIQKFRTGQAQTYPRLSDRSDIIVMTDEAHRTQYDTFALNMRKALPNAAFIGFTGTPLMEGEEKTREVFGEYVSVYNFRQSVEDGATVSLYYENRIPELQLTNADFNEDIEQVIEEAELDEAQQQRLEREFAREYQLITREDRLETIAQDIVKHFMGRGRMDKAMVISVDKMTTVRMYDKVQKHWKLYREALEKRQRRSADRVERQALQAQITYMKKTDMAVVISQSQNEVDDFRQKGLDILPHRKRIVKEDLETKFKDENDPLRIVFVCAMWITGFDVPSLSTLYLDKPMRNHTLMQTIARANRVFRDKTNGLIVDYVGVFRNLQKALAIYGTGMGGGLNEGDMPVKDKSELIGQLEGKIAEAEDYCLQQGVDTQAILTASTINFRRTGLLKDAVDALVTSDEIQKHFLALAGAVALLYRAILPDPLASEYKAIVALLTVIAREIRLMTPESDISDVLHDIEELLDISVASKEYVIRESSGPYDTNAYIDLSKIDFDALREFFERAHKHTEAVKLQGAINKKLKRMVEMNKSRTDYLERFQRLIDEYNEGSQNVEIHLERLIAFTQELNAEDQRHLAEQLTEEELAIFDLLTRSDVELSDQEKEDVKKVARSLLQTLKREKLVLDWRKKQQAQAEVKTTVKKTLDLLPHVYTKELFEQTCGEVYQHIFDSYYGQGQSIYT